MFAKTLKVAALSLAVVASLVPGRVSAQESSLPIDAKLSLDFVSENIFRGVTYADEAALQPELVLGYQAMTLGIWGNVDTGDDRGREDNFSETRTTFTYNIDLSEQFDLGLGFIYYYFPGANDRETLEYFVKLASNSFLNPTLQVNYDVSLVDGLYYNLGISHSIPLNRVHEDLNLDLSASLGYGDDDHNEFYYGTSDAAIADGVVGAALRYQASECLSFSWYTKYFSFLDSDIEDSVEAPGRANNNGEGFWFGAGTTYTF